MTGSNEELVGEAIPFRRSEVQPATEFGIDRIGTTECGSCAARPAT